MRCEELTYFTLLLWVTEWSGEGSYCMHTYVLVCSLVVTENRTVDRHIFAMRTYFGTQGPPYTCNFIAPTRSINIAHTSFCNGDF
jgi:hypothetical protein